MKMKQKTTQVKNYNNKLAEIYDAATTPPKGRWEAPHVIQFFLAAHLKKKGCHILDLGIGTGQASTLFSANGHHITGIDISVEMLARARKRLPHADLRLGNIEGSLPGLQEEYFDAVIASGVLEFIEHLDAVFVFVRRALKPKGFFCFTFEEYLPISQTQRWKTAKLGKGLKKPISTAPSFFVYRRTLKEIAALLKNTGFKIRKHRQFVAYYFKAGRIPVIYHAVLAQTEKNWKNI